MVTRHHEAWLAAIIESTDDAILSKTLDGVITSWNPAAERILGYTAAEAIGQKMLMLFPPDRVEEETDILERIARGERVQHFRTVRVRKDGHRIDVSVSISPVRDESGTIIGASKIARAITLLVTEERESAKRALEVTRRDVEGRYRALFDYAPDGIIISNAAGTYIDANASACRMLGYEPGELSSIDATRLVTDAEAAHIRPALDEIRTGRGYSRLWTLRRKDQTTFQADVIATVMPDGAILGMFRDITEREEAANTLRESEERFRQLAENISEVFWITNPTKHQMLYISPAYQAIWGRTCEELYASPMQWAEAVHPDDRERVAAAAKTRQIAGDYDETYRIVRPDGGVRWIRDRAYPVANDSGQVYRIVGIAQDITERRRLEEQFLRAQRLESVGRLAGGIAHDLNNVLAPILLSIELLRKSVQPPDGPDLLDTIRDSAQRGADLIKQVLLFARGLDGERVAIEPGPLLEDLVKVAQGTFPRSISVRLLPDDGLWAIQEDPTQLHQVFMNLLVNARDAMPNGGRLTISIQNATVDDTYAAMHFEMQPGRYVKVSVAGTGLGLSTSMGLVKSHGGFINLEREIGAGSQFAVYLPAGTGEAIPAAAPNARKAPARGRGETVLVVDDEEAIRLVAKKTLEDYGYRVLVAAHGAEAVSLYARHKHEISVVLTDMAMPIMDGAALIVALRAINPRVKIIASSGLPDRSASRRERPVQAFLHKPYTADAMLDAVTDVLASDGL